jgi:hypothetical protein
MVIRIQGRAREYVSPVFFGFLIETAGAISTVEILMAGEISCTISRLSTGDLVLSIII